MGRPRTKNRHLPPCVYLSNGAYYLVRKGRWERLGASLPAALAEYARRFDGPRGGMAELIDQYLANGTAELKPSSRQQYASVCRKLRSIFAEFSPEQVRMKHVAQMKLAFASKPSTGNQCIAVLREVFNFALEQQIVDTNPVVGINRHKEHKRSRLLLPAEFALIRGAGSPRLQAVMDVLYLSGQRVGDVLAIRPEDMAEEGLAVAQEKTGARLVVRWHSGLRAAVARLLVVRGRRLSYGMVERDWLKATRSVGVLDARLHDIRAMAAVAVGRGRNRATALLGHATEAQTETYLRDREVPVVDGPRVLGTK